MKRAISSTCIILALMPLIAFAQFGSPLPIPPTFSVIRAVGSPAGSHIAFLTNDSDGHKAFVYSIEGAPTTYLNPASSKPLAGASFHWGQDGRHLLWRYSLEPERHSSLAIYDSFESTTKPLPPLDEWLVHCFLDPNRLLLTPRSPTGREADLRLDVFAYDWRTSSTVPIWEGPREIAPIQINNYGANRFVVWHHQLDSDGEVDHSLQMQTALLERIGDADFQLTKLRQPFHKNLMPEYISADGARFLSVNPRANPAISMCTLDSGAFQKPIEPAELDPARGAVIGWLGKSQLIILQSPQVLSDSDLIVKRPGTGSQPFLYTIPETAGD